MTDKLIEQLRDEVVPVAPHQSFRFLAEIASVEARAKFAQFPALHRLIDSFGDRCVRNENFRERRERISGHCLLLAEPHT